MFGLIDSEIGSREPSERRQRFKEPSSVEARVLSGRQIQQRLHLEMAIQFHEIEEVAGLGPIEERKDLVGSEFLHSQRRPVVARLGWHGSVVDSQIDLTPFVTVTHLQAYERCEVTASGAGESCAFEGSLQCITQRDQSPLLPRDREIVKVTRRSVDESSNQKTGIGLKWKYDPAGSNPGRSNRAIFHARLIEKPRQPD